MNIFVPGLWIAVLIIFLVFEIMTLGLTSIWFAGGAIFACIAAAFGAHGLTQVGVFLMASGILMIAVKPVAGKYFNNSRQKTNLDAIIGKQAMVTIKIDNILGQGEINLAGQMWTARSTDDTIIEEGSRVEIVSIEGVKAIVKKV